MPKHESCPSSLPLDSFESATRPHLKRGDACLYCRNRRIRCSGTQPTCHQCANLERECVYDTIKRISRVEQLEEKVSEIEELLRSGGPSTVGVGARARAAGPRSRGTSGPQLSPVPDHRSSDANGYSISINTENQPRSSGSPSTANLSLTIGDRTVFESVSPNMLEVLPPSQSWRDARFTSASLSGSMFLATPHDAGTDTAQKNTLSQVPSTEQITDFSTLQPHPLHPGFTQHPNSFQIASTAAPHRTPEQIEQPQTQQQQQHQPMSVDMPDALAFLSQAASSFPAQPLHAIHIETQPISCANYTSPAAVPAPASPNMNHGPFVGALSHPPFSAARSDTSDSSTRPFPSATPPVQRSNLPDPVSPPTDFGGLRAPASMTRRPRTVYYLSGVTEGNALGRTMQRKG